MRDCGVDSLAMIYDYYGSYYSLAKLREAAKTTREGTKAFGLVKVYEEVGLETRAFKADMSLLDLEEKTYPFFAHVLKKRKFFQFFVFFFYPNI
ncbi:cysteine peptidase family C39 domain-containing protein, partial [Streptococcus thoraltensis]